MREFIKNKGHHADVVLDLIQSYMLIGKMLHGYTDLEDMYTYALEHMRKNMQRGTLEEFLDAAEKRFC